MRANRWINITNTESMPYSGSIYELTDRSGGKRRPDLRRALADEIELRRCARELACKYSFGRRWADRQPNPGGPHPSFWEIIVAKHLTSVMASAIITL
jgi:hypothetical protein